MDTKGKRSTPRHTPITLSEGLALWGKASKEKDPIAAFWEFSAELESTLDEDLDFTPYTFVPLLIEDKRCESLRDLASKALVSKSFEDDDERNRYWLPVLAQAYLHLGKKVQAKKALARALLYVQPFQSASVLTLEVLAEWYLLGKEREKVDVLYYEVPRIFGVLISLEKFGEQVHNNFHGRPKEIGKKFDEIMDEWYSIGWDLDSLSVQSLEKLQRTFAAVCDGREKYLPKLSKKWKEIRAYKSKRQEKSLAIFNSHPDKLTKYDVPAVLEYIHYNAKVLKDDKKFKAIIKFIGGVAKHQLVELMYDVVNERPIEDFLKIVKGGNSGELVPSQDTKNVPDIVDMSIYIAPQLGMSGKFKEALQLFDFLVEIPDLDLTVYNNALWAVMHDNNKLPIDPVRDRKYLKACLPYGPQNPAIFYNAACIYFELGELDKVFENIKLAIKYNYENIEALRTEPLFAPIVNDPKFIESFAKAKK